MRLRDGAVCWLAGAASLALLGTVEAIARDNPSLRQDEPGSDFTRAWEERQKGKAMFEEYLAEAVPWTGERVNEYVNRLGQNLTRAAGTPEMFTFRVIKSIEPNALGFPGGFVVVNSGMIALAESEAELASVLSHEIAHVHARHWQRQRGRLGWFSLLATVPLMVSTGPLVWVAFYGAAVAAPLAEARFSRSFEMEADGLSLEYLARAGYHPEAGVTMIERYGAAQIRRGEGKCGLWSTHPSSARRLQRARQLLVQVARPERALESTSEFESIREEVLRPDRGVAASTRDRQPEGDSPPPVLRHGVVLPAPEQE